MDTPKRCAEIRSFASGASGSVPRPLTRERGTRLGRYCGRPTCPSGLAEDTAALPGEMVARNERPMSVAGCAGVHR
jgi:hypothetical protein